MEHQYKPGSAPIRLEVTPASARWQYLAFKVVELGAGEEHQEHEAEREMALVPLAGAATVTVAGTDHRFSRSSVFDEVPRVLYVPPRSEVSVTAEAGGFVFSVGSAPAEGRYPVRIFEPEEMKIELRGGGTAHRQINHVLAPPLPAERLILYEVYVPRGTWSGWPPHCHDGFDGSPYLEEVYYFRLDPADGFAMHRNWRVDEDFDETFLANDGDAVLVTKGYHSSVAAPGSHLYFLNYLAGDLVAEDRRTPPCFLDSYTWIEDDWSRDAWTLPVIGQEQPGRS